ncbi:MAG TPA: antibiotic biosynthesis monooxygenase [Ktedonobacteraceae bacterium]|nr:antibiotic biosynthesis monooxygenase [Ktedonobacteraceae bacterium]
MYAVIRRIKVQPHLVDESITRMRQGLMPFLKDEPGFIEFSLVMIGENEGVSITIFETRETAEEGNKKSLEWARDQIFPLAQGPAEIVGVGEVVFSQSKASPA